MGGNARATNKVTGKDTLAQKIPIKEIGRTNFIKKFVALFEEIDKRFQKMYKRPLWANKSILKNGVAFNGSTSFIMNPEIKDEDVIPFKPTSGDIDIMVKESDKEDIWHLLDSFESKPKIMKDVVYKGSNKLTLQSLGKGEQINCVFEVTFKDIVTQSQVDFEFTKFQGKGDSEEPNEFSRFGHSSALSDAQNGFKGVSHKYVLRALAGGASYRKDVLILQPSGSYEKPKFRKTKGEHITELNMNKFSVAKGLRKAYELQMTPDNKPWIEDGKKVYKEIPTKDSNYETSVKTMFTILFKDIDDGGLNKMWSFVGVVELMKKHLDKKSIIATFERFLDIQWGFRAQKLERDDKDADFVIKANAVNYFIKKFPALKKFDKEIKKMTDRFYENYDKAKLTEEMQVITGNPFRDFIKNLEPMFKVPVTEEFIEYINEAEYKVPKIKKEKNRKLNPKTNRMKNSKKTKYFETDIPPEKRSFKNLPRYSDKSAICRFQDWLCIKGDGSGLGLGKSPNGKWYGWSHRAVFGFETGHVMKPGHIGNKFEYSEEVNKKYWALYDKDSEKAEEYRKSLANFKPYKIKDDEDAKLHATRFAKDVS